MALFGLGDRNLKLLREAFQVQLTGRGTSLRLAGDKEPVEKVAALVGGLIGRFRNGWKASAPAVAAEVEKAVREHQGAAGAASGPGPDTAGDASEDTGRPRSRDGGPPGDLDGGAPAISLAGLARSGGQESYLRAILENEMVFCIGPAGTGKTFLAVRMAVSFLRRGAIKRIVLCRPAVEAGERLGFLPGDFQAKINPYLSPLYDALNDILDYDQVKRYLEREIIEVLPLAYMRGRTLNGAFIILDEGQNTSIAQMKMFLTRMGMSSRIVVNGDITQVDLPEGMPSGLIHAHRIIREIKGIAWVEMQKADIVRHPLVRKIVEAYESAEPSGR
jgi:phosphate starvation-inducible PhoH-like protein